MHPTLSKGKLEPLTCVLKNLNQLQYRQELLFLQLAILKTNSYKQRHEQHYISVAVLVESK